MKKVYNNVTSIGFKLRFIGDGIVNADSSDQKYDLASRNLMRGDINNSNYRFSKKVFFNTDPVDPENGEYGYNIKVTSACIHHEIFKNIVKARGYGKSSALLYSLITQKDYILSGYLFTVNKSSSASNNGVGKSSITLCDALSVERFMKPVCMSVRTQDVNKNVSDTSLWYEESVGKLEYTTHGYIDLTELQFISGDIKYNRLHTDAYVGGEKEKMYLDALKRNFGSDTDYAFKPYKIANQISKDPYAEIGILLSMNDVDGLIKYYLKRYFGFCIWRAKAYLKINGPIVLSVKMADGTEDEITVSSEEELNGYTFNYYQKYVEDTEGRNAVCDEVYSMIAGETKKRRDENDLEKENKKNNKSKSKSGSKSKKDAE